MNLTLIRTVYNRHIVETITIIAICVVITILMGIFMHNKKTRIIFAVSILVTLVIAAILLINLYNIHLDIEQQSFVTYYGSFVVLNGGQGKLDTVTINDDGKEIRLLCSGTYMSEGEYFGVVVYGERSKIVVSCNESDRQ